MPLFDIDPAKDPNSDDRTAVSPADPAIAAFVNNQQEMLDQNRIVMREMQQTFGRAAEYVANLYTLPANQAAPQMLAGFDLSRMRMLVSTSSSQVVIGHYDTTASIPPQGFYLPVGNTEVKAIDEIWIRNADPNNVAYVSIWIEKSAN